MKLDNTVKVFYQILYFDFKFFRVFFSDVFF